MSSQLDRLKARERPEESVVQEALIVNQGSSLWSRRGMTLSCDGRWAAGCSVYYQANYLAYGSTQVQHRDVTLLFSGDSALNLISVFIRDWRLGVQSFSLDVHILIFLFFFDPAWIIGQGSLNISFQKDLVLFKNVSIDWQMLIRTLKNEKTGGLGFRFCNWK